MNLRAVIAAGMLALMALPAQAVAKSAHLDPSFGDNGLFIRPPDPENFSSATDMAVMPDGRLIVFGTRYVTGSSAAFSAFGFTANGHTDATFGASGAGVTDFLNGEAGVPRVLGVVDDGVLIDGLLREPGNSSGPPTLHLIRMVSDGTLDPGFGTNGIIDTGVGTYGGVHAARMSDGRVVAAMTGPSGPDFDFPDAMVARFLPSGELDPSFGGDGTVLVSAPRVSRTDEGPLVLLKSGAVVVAGSVSIERPGADFRARSVLYKLTADGRLDESFGSKGFVRVPHDASFINDLAIGRGGRLVGVGSGAIDSAGVDYRPEVTRFTRGGKIDKAFGERGVASISAAHLGSLSNVIVKRSGAMLVAGVGNATPSDDCCEDGGDDGDFLLARLKASGRPDRSFARKGVVKTDVAHGSEGVAALGMQRGGRIVIAGTHGYYFFRGPTEQQVTLAGYVSP